MRLALRTWHAYFESFADVQPIVHAYDAEVVVDVESEPVAPLCICCCCHCFGFNFSWCLLPSLPYCGTREEDPFCRYTRCHSRITNLGVSKPLRGSGNRRGSSPAATTAATNTAAAAATDFSTTTTGTASNFNTSTSTVRINGCMSVSITIAADLSVAIVIGHAATFTKHGRVSRRRTQSYCSFNIPEQGLFGMRRHQR